MSDNENTDRRMFIKSVGSIAGTTAFTGIAAGNDSDHTGRGEERDADHPGEGRGHEDGHPGRGQGKNKHSEEVDYEYEPEIISEQEKDDVIEVNVEVEETHVGTGETEITKYAFEVPKKGTDGTVKGGEIETSGDVSIQRGHHPIPPEAEDIIERWDYFVDLEDSCDAWNHTHRYGGLTFELTRGANTLGAATISGAIGALVGSAAGLPGTVAGALSGFIGGMITLLTDSTEYTLVIEEWDQSAIVTDVPMFWVAASTSYNQRDSYYTTRIGTGNGHPFAG